MRKQFIFLLFVCLGFSSIAQIGAVIGKDNRHNEYVSVKNKAPFSTAKLAFAITKNATSDKIKCLQSING